MTVMPYLIHTVKSILKTLDLNLYILPAVTEQIALTMNSSRCHIYRCCAVSGV